ncbi:MAG: hypothetical protein ACRD11_04750 [Terriglobia bacterium]
MKKAKFVAIPVLTLTLLACGVAQWVKAARQILPVVLPMVTNLVTAVSLLQGKTVSPTDFTTISNTSNQISSDLNLVGQLVNQYETSPNATTVEKINSALQDVSTNLNGLLASLHISDPATIQKITAVTTLISSEMNSIIQILPAVSSGQLGAPRQGAALPLSAAELKRQYNGIVSQPTANASVNSAFAGATLK